MLLFRRSIHQTANANKRWGEKSKTVRFTFRSRHGQPTDVVLFDAVPPARVQCFATSKRTFAILECKLTTSRTDLSVQGCHSNRQKQREGRIAIYILRFCPNHVVPPSAERGNLADPLLSNRNGVPTMFQMFGKENPASCCEYTSTNKFYSYRVVTNVSYFGCRDIPKNYFKAISSYESHRRCRKFSY